jgi:hypothetical protein
LNYVDLGKEKNYLQRFRSERTNSIIERLAMALCPLWSMGLVESIKSTAKGLSKSLSCSVDRLK